MMAFAHFLDVYYSYRVMGFMDYLPFKQYLPLAITFGVIVSALYNFGYWGSFDINVLEFVGVADLGRLAVYPLLVSLLAFLFGALLADIGRGDSFPPGGAPQTPSILFVFKHWRIFVIAGLIIIWGIGGYTSSPNRWLIVAVLVGLLSVPLSHSEFIIRYIPNPRLRQGILFYILLIPPLAFHFGHDRADDVKKGRGPLTVDIVRSKLSLDVSENKPVTYIGHLGEYFALYEATSQSVALVKLKEDAPLFFKPKQAQH